MAELGFEPGPPGAESLYPLPKVMGLARSSRLSEWGAATSTWHLECSCQGPLGSAGEPCDQGDLEEQRAGRGVWQGFSE